MSIESRVETVLKSTIASALTTAGITADTRAWTASDESTATEPRTYPLVGILWSPNVPKSYRSCNVVIPVTITCATLAPDDPKRTALLALYECVRGVLDSTNFVTAFSVGTGSYQGAIIREGGGPAIEGNEQSITLLVDFHMCQQ